MIFQIFKTLAIGLSFVIIFTGCISVNIAPESLTPAENPKYTKPLAPFAEVESSSADKAWRNPENGNAITYVSECGEVKDLNLKQVAKTLLKAQGIKIKSQTTITLNGVNAVESHGFRATNGSTIKIELITIRLKNCMFNLAYLGSGKNLDENTSDFQKFKENFKGP